MDDRVTPEHLRALAHEYRVNAQLGFDRELKVAVLDVAAEYDKLAAEIEATQLR